MRYIYIMLLVMGVSFLNSCDESHTDSTMGDTTFFFDTKGEIQGQLTDDTATIQCDANRTILTFKQNIPSNIEGDEDLLFGEIILAFLPSDTIGTFPLNGITETRVNGQVGFVGLLNQLQFDDLSAQYISNVQRLQTIKTGSLIIEKWSRVIGETIEGNLKVVLIHNEEEVTIEGAFNILIDENNGFCLTNK